MKLNRWRWRRNRAHGPPSRRVSSSTFLQTMRIHRHATDIHATLTYPSVESQATDVQVGGAAVGGHQRPPINQVGAPPSGDRPPMALAQPPPIDTAQVPSFPALIFRRIAPHRPAPGPASLAYPLAPNACRRSTAATPCIHPPGSSPCQAPRVSLFTRISCAGSLIRNACYNVATRSDDGFASALSSVVDRVEARCICRCRSTCTATSLDCRPLWRISRTKWALPARGPRTCPCRCRNRRSQALSSVQGWAKHHG